jgi:hypothetical protein
MVLKLDLEKVYVWLKWSCVNHKRDPHVLKLPRDLMSIIKHCVSFPPISLNWNGKKFIPFVEFSMNYAIILARKWTPINLTKVFFSRNTTQTLASNLSKILENWEDKTLDGVLEHLWCIKGPSNSPFIFLLSKWETKLTGWKIISLCFCRP